MKLEKLYFNIFYYDKYLIPRKIKGSFTKLEKNTMSSKTLF